MKKLFLIIFTIFLFSCSNENIDLNVEPAPNMSDIPTSRSLSNTPDLWKGVPVNIIIVNGTSNKRVYLSTRPKGNVVDLHTEDDATGRQRWYLDKVGNSYNIKIAGGVYTNLKYLSTVPKGNFVDLFNYDDATGRQRWTLNKIEDYYHIKNAGGVYTNRKFLSTGVKGNYVDLFDYDDATGRQRWNITPAGEYDLIDISYDLSPKDLLEDLPGIIQHEYYTNGSSTQNITSEFTLVRKISESSSFTQTHGLSVTQSQSFSLGFKIPVVNFDLGGQASVTTTISNTHQYGETVSEEKTHSHTIKVNTPPNKKSIVKYTVNSYKATVKYKAKLRSKIDPKVIIEQRGVWTGVQIGRFDYTILEEDYPKTNRSSQAIIIRSGTL